MTPEQLVMAIALVLLALQWLALLLLVSALSEGLKRLQADRQLEVRLLREAVSRIASVLQSRKAVASDADQV